MAALIFAPGFGGGLAGFGQTTPFFVAAVMAFLGGLICLKEMPSDEWIKSQVEARSEAANPNKKEQSAEEKAAEDGKSAELARSHRPMILLLFVNGMVLVSCVRFAARIARNMKARALCNLCSSFIWILFYVHAHARPLVFEFSS
jgi:hypothetical protein